VAHTDSINNGWLKDAARVPSPNFNYRPAGVVVDLLVIHNISLPPGEFGGSFIKDFFCNCLDSSAHPYFAGICSLEVSAHLLIERTGEITQFVPFDKRAWHAGESEFEGRTNCNDFSIGIELEGTDEVAYTDEQYGALLAVTRAIQRTYPLITGGKIVGHHDIAPGRKTDPGPSFDWSRYRRLLSR
jgi:AmpD protein